MTSRCAEHLSVQTLSQSQSGSCVSRAQGWSIPTQPGSKANIKILCGTEVLLPSDKTPPELTLKPLHSQLPWKCFDTSTPHLTGCINLLRVSHMSELYSAVVPVVVCNPVPPGDNFFFSQMSLPRDGSKPWQFTYPSSSPLRNEEQTKNNNKKMNINLD